MRDDNSFFDQIFLAARGRGREAGAGAGPAVGEARSPGDSGDDAARTGIAKKCQPGRP